MALGIETTDLKLGDWVSFSDVPCKIVGLTKDGVTIDCSKFGQGGQGCADIVDIFPIPLTTELLEKNRYVLIGDNGEYQRYRDDLIIRKIGDSSQFAVYLPCGNFDKEETVLLSIIDYVHELQHLLWTLEYEAKITI